MTGAKRRPLSVTVISWLCVMWALVSMVPKAFLFMDPATRELALEFSQAISGGGWLRVPLWVQLWHALLGVPVMILSGLFMLRGRSWALVTLLFWMLGALVLNLAVAGLTTSLYLKLATAALIVIVLTRGKALAFFLSRRES